ncbi:MAG: hypothetical protein EOP51_28885, partial [Sphingobacteriales bacterium]
MRTRTPFLTLRTLLALIISLSATTARAQVDYLIGTGTTANTCSQFPSPYGQYYEASRTQFLYLASELTAAGMGAGVITAVKFDVTSLVNGTCLSSGMHRSYTIKMGGTTTSSLTGYVAGISTVVYGPTNYQPVVGINSFPLGTPFIWNGTDNIVLDICQGTGSCAGQGPSGYTGNASVNFTTTTYASTYQYYTDCSGSLCGTTSGSSLNSRSNVIFEYGVPCNGVPTATVSGPTDACSGKPFTLSLSPFYSGISVIWQQSTDNVTYVPATGTVNGANQLTQSITVPTYFRALITCLNGGQTYTTAPFKVDVSKFYYCYCDQSKATTTTGGTDIGNVSLISYPTGDTIMTNGIATPLYSNANSTQNYTDFRRVMAPTPLYADTQYRVLVSQIHKGGTFTVSRAAVYIDYNRNGTFEVPERLLLESTSVVPPFPGRVTDTFKLIVPTDSLRWHGLTGMRVILVAGATDPDTCLSYADGETEDYLIDLRYTPCDGIPNAGAIEGDTSLCIGYDYFLTDSTYQKYRHG